MNEFKICIDVVGVLKGKNHTETIDKLEGRIRALIHDVEVHYRYVTLKDTKTGDIYRLP